MLGKPISRSRGLRVGSSAAFGSAELPIRHAQCVLVREDASGIKPTRYLTCDPGSDTFKPDPRREWRLRQEIS